MKQKKNGALMKNFQHVDPQLQVGCGGRDHVSRRSLLKLAGLSGLSWLTPLGSALARSAGSNPSARPRSLIMLWLEGAPSQLETFDPHPGTEIAAGSLARETNARDIRIGDGFEQLADVMENVSLVRALTSKEGDHERAIYNIKTGFRPDPTLLHPAIGSVICHDFSLIDEGKVDIPRHVSIIPGQFPAKGGYLGDRYDAFKINDPQYPVPDVTSNVDQKRQRERLTDLDLVDREFLKNRIKEKSGGRTLGDHNLQEALKMMSSDQLAAFDVSKAPKSTRDQFGDTAFGRGCLAALQLIENGVRCVEITLGGWDTHANNHELQAGRINILDPAFAALIRELKARDLLDTTMVVCGGEFGRTPFVNPLGGRDHWPHGFSMALAGGGIQGGRVVGETSSVPKVGEKNPKKLLKDPSAVEDIHATIFKAFGIDHEVELDTPIGRPMVISEGKPITRLLEK